MNSWLYWNESRLYWSLKLDLPASSTLIISRCNNQHSENENLRLGNFWRGMEIFGALLAELHW